MSDFAVLRREMVERQIASRGVRDLLVLEAMRNVPRETFLPKSLQEFAYADAPLPIDANQTISQPYIVAFMAEALALKGGETVLEIGAGSGYAAAVLSRIADQVYTVERIGQLARRQRPRSPISAITMSMFGMEMAPKAGWSLLHLMRLSLRPVVLAYPIH